MMEFGVQNILMSHEQETSRLSIMQSLRRDLDRHERVLSDIKQMAVDIAKISVAVEALQRFIPGVSPACMEHREMLHRFQNELDALVAWRETATRQMAKWGGGLAVLVIVIGLAAPTFRDAISVMLSKAQPSHNMVIHTSDLTNFINNIPGP